MERAAPHAPPSAAREARRRTRRPRLGVEIAVALAVKFVLLYAIWAAWFAHPVSRDLDARSVAAALVASRRAPVDDATTR